MTFTHPNLVNLLIVYELDTWSRYFLILFYRIAYLEVLS